MSVDNNIEDLFKKKLDSFQSPVSDMMWSNISSSIGTNSLTGLGVKSLADKLFSTTGIAAVTGVICTIATILVMSTAIDKEEPSKTDVTAVSVEKVDEDNELYASDDELAVSNIINNEPVQANDPSVKEEKTETFRVIPTNSSTVNNVSAAPKSAINSFLTPKSRIKNRDPIQENSIQNTAAEENEITIIETQEDELTATIIASPVGGYAPLDVYFSSPATRGSVLWNFGDGSSSGDLSPSHTFEKYGVYTVELIVTAASGEQKKDYRIVEVEANSAITVLPNIFTPNGDGINDLCAVKGKNLAFFQMKVFDRSGESIFQSQSMENSWDGKDKFGENISIGTYFYVINARGIDGKVYEHSGPITLSR